MALGDGEFVDFQWRDIQSVIDGVIEWKRDAYKEGLSKLGLFV